MLCGLVNNAGVAWPAPLMHQPLADFRKLLDANLTGTFIVTQVGNHSQVSAPLCFVQVCKHTYAEQP